MPAQINTEIKFKGKTIKVPIAIGTVYGVSKHSETSVSMTSGSISQNSYGTISSTPASVSSRTTEILEFFFKQDGSEDELPCKFYDTDVAVRDGQKVILIYGKVKENFEFVRLINLASKQFHYLESAKTLLKNWRMSRPDWLVLLIFFGIIIGGYWFYNPTGAYILDHLVQFENKLLQISAIKDLVKASGWGSQGHNKITSYFAFVAVFVFGSLKLIIPLCWPIICGFVYVFTDNRILRRNVKKLNILFDNLARETMASHTSAS